MYMVPCGLNVLEHPVESLRHVGVEGYEISPGCRKLVEFPKQPEPVFGRYSCRIRQIVHFRVLDETEFLAHGHRHFPAADTAFLKAVQPEKEKHEQSEHGEEDKKEYPGHSGRRVPASQYDVRNQRKRRKFGERDQKNHYLGCE